MENNMEAVPKFLLLIAGDEAKGFAMGAVDHIEIVSQVHIR